MKKKINMKIWVPVMTLAVVALLIFRIVVIGVGSIFSSGIKLGYVGTATYHNWKGSYISIDGKFTQSMKPDGDNNVIRFEVETKSGRLDIEILDKSGQSIWSADNVQTGDYEVRCNDKVKIVLTADEHSGSFSFTY